MSGATPDMADIFRIFGDAQRARTWTALPGRVLKYDAATQIAEVQALVRNPYVVDEEPVVQEPLPVLPSVHILFPQGGGCSISWRLAVGDDVLVLVSTLSASGYLRTGEVADCHDLRRNSLGSTLFGIPGVLPKASRLPDPGAGNVVIEAPTDVLIGAGAEHAIARGDAVKAWIDALVAVASSPPTPPAEFLDTADILSPKGKVT